MTNQTERGLFPAYLFVGSPAAVVISFLQNVLCLNGCCGVCIACTKIINKNHDCITWLRPERLYALEHLDPIFERIRFEQEPSQHHFFVLEDAHFLSIASSNRLLKHLEEPPQGYHFLLLAHNVHDIIPTLRSRCVIYNYHSKGDMVLHSELLHVLTTSYDSHVFTALLDKVPIDEQESRLILDQLLLFWTSEMKENITHGDGITYEMSKRVLSIIKRSYQMLPMPGSVKVFWKNFFLALLTARSG